LQIYVCIGAANRDPAEFAEPHQLDIGRSPNRHLAFACGIHQCASVMPLGSVTPRSANDRLIAMHAIISGIPLLHRDREFDLIANVEPKLRLVATNN
jgi:hypothetical protein